MEANWSRAKKIFLTSAAESIYKDFRGYITFHCDEPFRDKQLNKFELDSLNRKWHVNYIITINIWIIRQFIVVPKEAQFIEVPGISRFDCNTMHPVLITL